MPLDTLFGSILGAELTPLGVLLCTAASLLLGVCVALLYKHGAKTASRSFVVTLVTLPAIVQMVIMMVNGNLGTGVAVMGAFSLVRFRSVPGSAREIGAIFFAMAMGLAMAMGYLGFAVLFLLLVGGATLVMDTVGFGKPRETERDLRITIPETLDYEGVFDDLFATYTQSAELMRVRTTNMGSLYELSYRVILKGPEVKKEFIDEIRTRNGNLNITCNRPENGTEGL